MVEIEAGVKIAQVRKSQNGMILLKSTWITTFGDDSSK